LAVSQKSAWLNSPPPANGVQSRCNVGTNTEININATDNTATKTAASESSNPNGRQRIRANRHQRTRSGSLNDLAQATGDVVKILGDRGCGQSGLP
jgi:hypothetical protein